jgi:hypothetical protein
MTEFIENCVWQVVSISCSHTANCSNGLQSSSTLRASYLSRPVFGYRSDALRDMNRRRHELEIDEPQSIQKVNYRQLKNQWAAEYPET